MELIKGEKAINSAIVGLRKRLNNLDEDMHRIAVSAIHHALQNSNNWEVVSRLVKTACGYDELNNKFKSRSIRSANFRQWIVKHLPVKWEHKNETGRYKSDPKKLAEFDVNKCMYDIMTPWYEDVKDANEFTGYDLKARLITVRKAAMAAIDKLDKAVAEGETQEVIDKIAEQVKVNRDQITALDHLIASL